VRAISFSLWIYFLANGSQKTKLFFQVFEKYSRFEVQEEIRRHDQGAQMEGAFGYRKPFIKLDFF